MSPLLQLITIMTSTRLIVSSLSQQLHWLVALQNKLAASVIVSNMIVARSTSLKSKLGQEIRVLAFDVLPVQVHYVFLGSLIEVGAFIHAIDCSAVHFVCQELR